MFKRFLFNIIKNDKRIRKEFIDELTEKEKCEVLESINYNKLVVDTDFKDKTITGLKNCIMINCRIEDCKIEDGITNSVLHNAYITNNTTLPNKDYKPIDFSKIP